MVYDSLGREHSNNDGKGQITFSLYSLRKGDRYGRFKLNWPRFVWKLKLTDADLWQTWFLDLEVSVALMERIASQDTFTMVITSQSCNRTPCCQCIGVSNFFHNCLLFWNALQLVPKVSSLLWEEKYLPLPGKSTYFLWVLYRYVIYFKVISHHLTFDLNFDSRPMGKWGIFYTKVDTNFK